jgi:hypothetical protein
MEKEQKELWHKKYLEFCKETGAQLAFTPRIVPVSNDGTVFKADVAIDVIEYKGE